MAISKTRWEAHDGKLHLYHLQGEAIRRYQEFHVLKHQSQLDFFLEVLQKGFGLNGSSAQLVRRFQTNRTFKFLPLPSIRPKPIAKPRVSFAAKSTVRYICPRPQCDTSVLQPSSQPVAECNGSQHVPPVRIDVEVSTTSPKTIITYFNVFFANITMWGPTAQNYFFTEEFLNKYQIVGLAETHTQPQQDVDLQAKWRAHGFTPQTNPAMKYHDTGGSHGGEAVLTAKHLHAIPLHPDVVTAALSANGEKQRWTAIEVRLSKCSVLFISAYFWDGEKLSSRN